MHYLGKNVKWYGKIGSFLLFIEKFYPLYIVFANILSYWTNTTVDGVGFGGFI
jgi:hypothetical protein